MAPLIFKKIFHANSELEISGKDKVLTPVVVFLIIDPGFLKLKGAINIPLEKITIWWRNWKDKWCE